MTISQRFRALRMATVIGWQEWRVLWSWHGLLLGDVTRVICQVVFFAMVGALLGSEARLLYILVGNCVLVGPLTAMFAMQASAWERRLGTIPLLLSTPIGATETLVGRSLDWLVHGWVTAVLAFVVTAPLFGLPLSFPGALAILPLLAIVVASAYAFAIFLCAVVLRLPGVDNLLYSTVALVIMAIGGVNVPISVLPLWAQTLAGVMPVTHGLMAVRLALAGGSAQAVLIQAGLEGLVGLSWLVLAVLAFRYLVDSSRRSDHSSLE